MSRYQMLFCSFVALLYLSLKKLLEVTVFLYFVTLWFRKLGRAKCCCGHWHISRSAMIYLANISYLQVESNPWNGRDSKGIFNTWAASAVHTNNLVLFIQMPSGIIRHEMWSDLHGFSLSPALHPVLAVCIYPLHTHYRGMLSLPSPQPREKGCWGGSKEASVTGETLQVVSWKCYKALPTFLKAKLLQVIHRCYSKVPDNTVTGCSKAWVIVAIHVWFVHDINVTHVVTKFLMTM